MKALDNLKADIDDYNEVLASRMIELKKQVDYLYDNYDNLTVKSIRALIEGLNNEISIISKEDNILKKWKNTTNYLKQNRHLKSPAKKDKKEEKKDKFQLCVVQGGEEIVTAEVTTDEFIQIMHEQAEEEQEKNKYNGIATEIGESGLLGGARYKRQEVTFNELLRSKPFNCTDKED